MKKKPPPKSPQGFNIHEPEPRLKDKKKERDKEKGEREKREREASAKVNIGKEVLKFDTHLSTLENQRSKLTIEVYMKGDEKA